MKQKLLFMVILVFIFSSSFAQSVRSGSNGSISITEVNSLLNPSSGSARIASSGTVDVQRLNELLTQVQSSIYFLEGTVKTYGDSPTNLSTDLSSLSQVNNSITAKQDVEIVTITINSLSELNSNINFAAFSNFPKLKYVYFISNVNTTSENIVSHISNYDSRFNIFYKIDKGDRNQ